MGGIIAPIARKHLIQNVSHPAVSAKPSFKVFAAYAARDTKNKAMMTMTFCRSMAPLSL
jgi:hypothetical protein